MTRSLFAVCFVVIIGCGSNSPPAKSAESTQSPRADSDASGEASSATKSEAKAESPEAQATPRQKPAEAATNEDVQAVLQLVIDDDALAPYLHLDRPDRFPLRIAGHDLPQGLELSKATKPVQIVDTNEAEKKPVIVFTEIQVNGDEASVRYRYDVEKVRGASTLKRREGHWVLSRSRVTEH